MFVRVARGDVADVHASLVAVGHVNDVAPSGAERVIDDLLGGMITTREQLLRGSLGTTHFLPTITSPLAVGAVVVVCLGDAETFTTDRLGEIGQALVDAAASVGARDVATVVPAATVAKRGHDEAAELLVRGILAALTRVGPDLAPREVTIVEKSGRACDAVLEGVRRAVGRRRRTHVYAKPLEPRRAAMPEVKRPPEATPPHLRLGLTRAGPRLKVTRIGDDAFDRACVVPYPAKLAEQLPERIQTRVLRESDRERRMMALRELGAELGKEFLELEELADLALFEKRKRGAHLVLRVDGATTNIPWELVQLADGRVLGLEFALARQVELGLIGRPAAWTDRRGPLRALVIGNRTGGLAGAVAEAEDVARLLEERAQAQVKPLIGSVTYQQVISELEKRNYDVLHYAGHAAYVEGKPYASGFVLAGGQLLTPDVLSTRRYVPRLVVANACHTARTGAAVGGTADDPFAGVAETRTLVSALLSAGARAFVGTQWQVADAAAVRFAGAFYEAIADVGEGALPIGRAMLEGRRAVWEQDPAQPAWAAYALYGNPWRTAL